MTARTKALILNSLGVTLTRLHRPDEARTVLEESVALSRRAASGSSRRTRWPPSGTCGVPEARPETAVACFEQSLAVRRTLGDRAGEGWMLLRVAETLAATGDASRAREMAAEAMAIAEAVR